MYLAALTLATSLATPLLAACAECLCGAGLELSEAQAVADKVVSNTLRAFLRSGRKSWQGPLAEKDFRNVRRQWESLRRHEPLLAEYFVESATHALEYFRQDPRLITELTEVPQRQSAAAKVLVTASGNR